MAAALTNDFLSTYVHPIDRKGRVSVPSAFRRILAAEGCGHLFCCPSPDGQTIDAGGGGLHRHVQGMIADHGAQWADRDVLETALLGLSHNLKIDSDGRVSLPEALSQRAQIAEQVVFVGKGYRFQMWCPSRFEKHFQDAQARVLQLWQQREIAR